MKRHEGRGKIFSFFTNQTTAQKDATRKSLFVCDGVGEVGKVLYY
jgi:hypothetical protein